MVILRKWKPNIWSAMSCSSFHLEFKFLQCLAKTKQLALLFQYFQRWLKMYSIQKHLTSAYNWGSVEGIVFSFCLGGCNLPLVYLLGSQTHIIYLYYGWGKVNVCAFVVRDLLNKCMVCWHVISMCHVMITGWLDMHPVSGLLLCHLIWQYDITVKPFPSHSCFCC